MEQVKERTALQEEIAFYEALVTHAKQAVDRATDDRDRAVTLIVVLMAQARLKDLRSTS